MGEYQLIVVGKAGSGAPRMAELDKATINSIEWTLDGAGGFSYSIPTLDPKAIWTEPVKYETQVRRNGSLFHWGCAFNQPEIGSELMTQECLGLFAYFQYRFIHRSLDYVGVDQQTIAWNLLNYAMTEWPGAGLGITSSGFVPSGVNRDRHYPFDEHGNIAELVKAFAGLQNGFDFDIEIFGDGRREWTPYYPSKGVVRTDLTLEWGRNIVDFNIPKDASRMANWVTATGSGDGPAKLEQSYVDIAARDANILLQDVISESTVLELPTLLEKAQAEVNARKNPIRLPTITVIDKPGIPVIGVLKTGDRVPVKIDHGGAQMTGMWRIVHMKLTPRTEELELVLNAA
ncbi:MAG: hypothetical protein ACR2M4_06430 [Actinomycetota bacterium]